MTAERVYHGHEVRAEGRRLMGPAIRYGDVSPSHRERFEAGAFALSDGRTRWLDVAHDRNAVIAHTDGGGLELRDTREALLVSATLPAIPAAEAALEGVRSGVYRGFSVEFDSLAERREAGLRVIERAALAGVGLVRSPSYQGSVAEIRQGKVRSVIPYGSRLACECQTGDCNSVRIERAEAIPGRDVLAVAGNFRRAIASVRRGSMTLEQTAAGLEVALSGEALGLPAARELAEMAKAVPIFMRPIFDRELSRFVEDGEIAVFELMALRGILLGATDNSDGWPEVEFGEPRAERSAPEPPAVPAAVPNVRRRRW